VRARSRRIEDAHFSPAPAGALGRTPSATTAAEAEFLALGEGARLWLAEAAAAGTTKIRVKMAAAVDLAKLFGAAEVNWALGHAAVHARFAEADLPSILDHHAGARPDGQDARTHQAGEAGSLTQGTGAWAAFGTTGGGQVRPVPAVGGHEPAAGVAR